MYMYFYNPQRNPLVRSFELGSIRDCAWGPGCLVESVHCYSFWATDHLHEAATIVRQKHEEGTFVNKYLESQWPLIMGYFGSHIGYFRVEWPVILGYLAFKVVISEASRLMHTTPKRCALQELLAFQLQIKQLFRYRQKVAGIRILCSLAASLKILPQCKTRPPSLQKQRSQSGPINSHAFLAGSRIEALPA